MDGLLKEIRCKDEAAASVLEQADLRSDSDLQLLTLQELGELFPGVKNVKLRRKIFDIIHTQKPIDVLIKKFKDFIPHEYLRAALTENGVLVEYLKMLKEMKTKMNKVQDFLDAHINLLEDFRKSQPLQDQYKGEIMDILLKEIRCKDGKAASVLEEAGLSSDSDLQLLTLQDLGELFPGVRNAKLRRTIFDVVHTQKPIDVLIKEFKDFIPHEYLRAALTEHGVLVDYLKMLKEMKTQMNKVQDFLDAHINLMEDFRKSQPSQDKGEIMDILLKEIRRKDGKAASILEEADLRVYSDIQLLTLQELGELFPGVENFQKRREIFAIIHTQKPIDVLIEEFKDLIPHESLRAALTENGVLVDYLKMLKEMKIQMNKVQDFLDAHINLLEDFRKSQPLQNQDKGSLSSSPVKRHNSQTGEIMDVLLTEIRHKDGKAASVLENAGLRADSDLQLLTLQDLGLLFPGVKNFKQRIEIFAIIQTQKQIDVLIEEFKDFIPHESLRAALTKNRVLVNYLKMLKEMKTQMNKVQDFLDAHINLLEDLRKSQPSQHQDKDFSSSSCSIPPLPTTSTHGQPQKRQDCSGSGWSPPMLSITSTHGQPHKRQVTYKMVVSGVTFNAHNQLLDRLTTSSGDKVLKLLSQEDGEVIIVFCPVVSRTGTDVEAAMAQVTGDKPVILVVMHHTYRARSVPSVKTWKDSCKVVLCVHVLYHEKVPGLLPCQENNDAISRIRTELLKYGVDITESTSGDDQSWLSSQVSRFQNSFKKKKQ